MNWATQLADETDEDTDFDPSRMSPSTFLKSEKCRMAIIDELNGLAARDAKGEAALMSARQDGPICRRKMKIRSAIAILESWGTCRFNKARYCFCISSFTIASGIVLADGDGATWQDVYPPGWKRCCSCLPRHAVRLARISRSLRGVRRCTHDYSSRPWDIEFRLVWILLFFRSSLYVGDGIFAGILRKFGWAHVPIVGE